jgi:hypothetical protein
MTEKRQNSQGYIIRILQHFATKLWNITNFVMLFQAVMKFLSRLVEDQNFVYYASGQFKLECFQSILFFSTFANCCYKFLENPGINRDKPLRDSILNVLAILVKKYNQSLSVGVKVIQLLQHFEHLVAPMAQLVQVCAVEHGLRNIVVDILR